jgi:site-specific recombinase XerD
MTKVMYAGGLRLMECLRLEVMELDFAKFQVHVRGKGGRHRLTTLPPSIYGDMKSYTKNLIFEREYKRNWPCVSSEIHPQCGKEGASL